MSLEKFIQIRVTIALVVTDPAASSLVALKIVEIHVDVRHVHLYEPGVNSSSLFLV
jgi:hypothetical protein